MTNPTPPQDKNVSAKEIDLFDSYADQWWDTVNGVHAPLHHINPVRTKFIIDAYADAIGLSELKSDEPSEALSQAKKNDSSADQKKTQPLAGVKVLDVGCGGGILTEALALLGADVTGIDLSEKSISVAQKQAEKSGSGAKYKVISSAELIATNDPLLGSCDIVTCMEVLEHVPKPDRLIADCAALCRVGGVVAMSTINRSAIAFFAAIFMAEYILKLIPVGTHHYNQLLRPSELSDWCRDAKLTPQPAKGYMYEPLTKSAAIMGPPVVNYLMAAYKCQSIK